MTPMGTSTLKIAMREGFAACTVEEAVKLIYETDHHSVILYSRNVKTLAEMCNDVAQEIKRRNSEIKDIGQQMLAIYPYRFDAVYECLPMYCSEISAGPAEEYTEVIHVGTDLNFGTLYH